jgi:hypothetical protein
VPRPPATAPLLGHTESRLALETKTSDRRSGNDEGGKQCEAASAESQPDRDPEQPAGDRAAPVDGARHDTGGAAGGDDRHGQSEAF